MELLICGLNYSPEPVGIGPYTSEMAAHFVSVGHDVSVVAANPYYPTWKIDPRYAGRGYNRSNEAGVDIWRCPLYVPSHPSGARRVLHYVSFAISSFIPVFVQALRRRPSLVMVIGPSLISGMVGKLAARMIGAKTWLHVQDFEVEAALATGLVRERSLMAQAACWFERRALSGFDQYSSISPRMCAKLGRKVGRVAAITEFRNWTDIAQIQPNLVSAYREEWGLGSAHVALYSGSLAKKQSISLIIDAARRLIARKDLTFVICGDGPERAKLQEMSLNLSNVQIRSLQPRERLSDLLSLASVHLLPQLAGAADLVLPSKLTNMLASGRPVVATAEAWTDLAQEVEGCGAVTEPGDADAFAAAIGRIIDDSALRAKLGANARRSAETKWSKCAILARAESEMVALCGDSRASERRVLVGNGLPSDRIAGPLKDWDV